MCKLYLLLTKCLPVPVSAVKKSSSSSGIATTQAIHHGIASKDNFKQITAIRPKIMLLLTLQVRSDLKPCSSLMLFLLALPVLLPYMVDILAS